MDPVIRNFRDVQTGGEGETSTRLIGPDDSPPNNVLLYLVIPEGGTSTRHTHEWEHSAYIIEGTGVLSCSGKEFPLKAGDAVLIPPQEDHQIVNTGTGPLVRIAINPLSSAAPRT